MILDIVGGALKLAGKIVDIIAEKGDDADDVRLKDIPGWNKLKKSCRERDAVNRFRREWKERDNKPDEE